MAWSSSARLPRYLSPCLSSHAPSADGLASRARRPGERAALHGGSAQIVLRDQQARLHAGSALGQGRCLV
eukprot:2356087-Rhodomonas_salina.1